MPNGNQNLTPMSGRDYHDIIQKVASVKDLNVEKLARLLELQAEWDRRQDEIRFNESMAAAQSEMSTISKDSANPATRSRYASLAALDNAIRPIYGKYGFKVDFSEEPHIKDDWLHLVASVSCGAITKHYHFFLPWTTQGARGGQVSTPTHAKMGAATYARRGLLKMIWNLAEEDDDGNTGGGRFKSSDPFPQEEKTPDPLAVDQILKDMERCATAEELEVVLGAYKGQWAGTPKADVERVRRRRDEMRTGFKPQAEGGAADGDHMGS